MIRLSAGEVQLTVLEGGTLRLDGGAMFGVVPKALWEKERPADDRNRILLAMNLLLIDDGHQRMLVDTGAGTRWAERWLAIHDLRPRDAGAVLEPAGLTPEEIDLVVCSHLHFDHAGGNTRVAAGGGVEPSFPNARYVVQRGEIETARWKNERTRNAYRGDDFEPLAADGRLWLVEGETRLGRHVVLRPAPGHTPHMQVPLVVTRERTVAFLADLVPTASHVPYPYVMAYDLEPLVTLETKKRFLPEALRDGWYLVLEHDPDMPLAVLREQGGRMAARPAEVGVS